MQCGSFGTSFGANPVAERIARTDAELFPRAEVGIKTVLLKFAGQGDARRELRGLLLCWICHSVCYATGLDSGGDWLVVEGVFESQSAIQRAEDFEQSFDAQICPRSHGAGNESCFLNHVRRERGSGIKLKFFVFSNISLIFLRERFML